MTGILLNHLPHHTHKLCSLVRCAVHFPKLPVKRTVPFDSTTVQLFSPYVLFYLAENSHRFFHTNGKRSRKPETARPGILRPGMTIKANSQKTRYKSICIYFLKEINTQMQKKKKTLVSRCSIFTWLCRLNPVPYSASKWPFTFGQETTKYELSFLLEQG